MNSVIGRTRYKSSIPDTFMINNTSESSKQIIADSFCHYFTNIGKQFADAITPSKHTFESYLKLERNSHSMFLNPTYPSKIFKIIKSFKMKKSTGHDGIGIMLLKSLGESVCKPVIPIYKAKNKKLLPMIDQYHFCQSYLKFLKGWYIAVFTHFWLDTTYFMTVNMASGTNIQQYMLSRNLLTTLCHPLIGNIHHLQSIWTYQMPLTQLIILFCWRKWNIAELGE